LKKHVLLIDGFNLYHSLLNESSLHKYKWINLYKLAEILIPKTHDISDVYYFTALANWDQQKVARHRLFIRVQEFYGVKIVYGKFKMREKRCRLCHGVYKIPEEKQTDVNIAITLFTLAQKDEFDTATILSGDSDLIPSIKAVKNVFPLKRIGIAIPIHRSANELQEVADFYMKIKLKHLNSCLLPEKVDTGRGVITRPSGWI